MTNPGTILRARSPLFFSAFHEKYREINQNILMCLFCFGFIGAHAFEIIHKKVQKSQNRNETFSLGTTMKQQM